MDVLHNIRTSADVSGFSIVYGNGATQGLGYYQIYGTRRGIGGASAVREVKLRTFAGQSSFAL